MARTSQLGTADSTLLGTTLATGVFASGASLSATAADTVEFGDVLTFLKELNLSVADTVNFSDSVTGQNTVSISVADTVNFSDTAIGSIIKRTLEETVQFSDSAISSLQTPSAVETVNFSDVVTIERAIVLALTETINFSETAVSSLQTPTGTDTVVFGITIATELLGAIELTVEDTVEFSDTAVGPLIKVGATDHAAEDTIEFITNTTIPNELSISDTVNFSDTTSTEWIKTIIDTVLFSDSNIANKVIDRSATDTLQLTASFAIDGTVNQYSIHKYSPIVAGGPMSPTEPSLTKAASVQFYHPTVSPTDTVTIRAPEFGDRERLKYMRINRETRGGSLKVYADPNWPQSKQLSMSFIGLKESEAQEVITFIYTHLGQEVGFTDWEGRTWYGFFVEPDQPVVRNRRTTVDISIGFEGELQ